MRAVWVTPALPHPAAAGGWAHEFELLRAVARDHDIEVLSADLDSPLDVEPLRRAGVGFTRVAWTPEEHPSNRVAIATQTVRARPNLVLHLRRDRQRALTSALADLVARHRPALVHITLGELAPLVDTVAVPTALFLFDAMTRDLERRLAIEQISRRRAQLRLDCARTRRFERRWYRKATGVAAVSWQDADWVEKLTGRAVDVIENPVSPEFFAPPEVARSDHVVTFVGTVNHLPNLDAIKWLANEIWPRVAARRPDAVLEVVGRSGDPDAEARVRAAVGRIGGRVEFDVADIRPAYWRAAVVVAPMRTGSGMRNKVIHAMACGAPVVATPAAVEGLSADAVAAAVVVSGAPEFADAVIAMLDDRGRRNAAAATGSRAVAALHTDVVTSKFAAWWTRVAAR